VRTFLGGPVTWHGSTSCGPPNARRAARRLGVGVCSRLTAAAYGWAQGSEGARPRAKSLLCAGRRPCDKITKIARVPRDRRQVAAWSREMA
jgi:hypothetical protein